MWIAFALASAFCLGFYDIFKKISVRDNNVLVVLLLNTVFGTLLMSPVLVPQIVNGSWGLGGTVHGHLLIVLKAVIVLSSWMLGYFAIKHLPLTIQGPINATRPVLVLVGALCIFGERLNWVQWIGILLGFASLYMISRIGSKEGFSVKGSRWLWMSIGATALGAVSALYDKYLLRQFEPFDVQAWYSLYQCIIMSVIVWRLKSPLRAAESRDGSEGGNTLVLSRCARRKGSCGTIDASDAKTPDTRFIWRWSIPCISLFLTVADLAYFYSLSLDGSMISIVSMIRRGSVLVSFLYGVVILHEKNIKAKLVDLGVLLVSLALLIIGASM